jgi:hypothetical protein
LHRNSARRQSHQRFIWPTAGKKHDPGTADDLVVSTCAYNQEYEDAAMHDLEARQVF